MTEAYSFSETFEFSYHDAADDLPAHLIEAKASQKNYLLAKNNAVSPY